MTLVKTPGGCILLYTFVSASVNYPGDRTDFPLWEVVTKSVFVGIFIIAAVIGNGLIITIVGLVKKMRTTTNLYIVNLAIADLMLAVCPIWIGIIVDVKKSWVVPGFFCKLNPFFQVSAWCAIAFTMMAITWDRFFAVTYPLKARVTESRVKVVVTFIWTSSFVIGLPTLLYYKYMERPWADYLETFCTAVWPVTMYPDTSCDHGRNSYAAYWMVVVALFNWTPMVVMTFSYLVIIYRLHFGREASTVSETMPDAQKRCTKRVVRLMFIILVAFIVCTIPFQICVLYDIVVLKRLMQPYWYQKYLYAARFLTFCHSCINPIVYGATSQSFRDAFALLLGRFCGKRQSPGGNSGQAAGVSSRPCTTSVSRCDLDMTQATSVTDIECSN